jgi:hypothetical protein
MTEAPSAFADLEFQAEIDALHPNGGAPEDTDGAHKVPNFEATAPSGPRMPWDIKPSGPSAAKRFFSRSKAPSQGPEFKPKAPAPRMPPGGLATPLADIYIMIGSFMSVADPVCGAAIISSAKDCGKSLEALAKQNPEVRRVLVKLVSGSAYGAVITAHVPIIMAVANHHLLPAFVPTPGPVQDDRPQYQENPAPVQVPDPPVAETRVSSEPDHRDPYEDNRMPWEKK